MELFLRGKPMKNRSLRQILVSEFKGAKPVFFGERDGAQFGDDVNDGLRLSRPHFHARLAQRKGRFFRISRTRVSLINSAFIVGDFIVINVVVIAADVHRLLCRFVDQVENFEGGVDVDLLAGDEDVGADFRFHFDVDVARF